MKRVRRKERIGNTSQCLTRSKKRAESDPFYKFPLDLVIKILLILPAKCIAKLIFVSKYWSSIICGKEFTELYLTRSSTRPHLLFAIIGGDMRKQSFHFSSEENPSSAHHRVSCYTPNSDGSYDFSPPIRGLICCQNIPVMIANPSTKVMIGNPTTGQFIALPRLKARKGELFSFLGYDHVNDQYKVLCMMGEYSYLTGRSRAFMAEEHQVFTLGSKQNWRMIECKHLHYLSRGTKGICNNGVVYYLAWINYVQTLICFDLRCENFNVIKLPRNVEVEFVANFSEKIAVTNILVDGRVDLWVLADASKQEWSKVSIVVQSWTSLVGNQALRFRGTLRSGELIFAPYSPMPFFLLCYDLKNNSARKVVIEGLGTDYNFIEVFLDHVESPMYLSKIRKNL